MSSLDPTPDSTHPAFGGHFTPDDLDRVWVHIQAWTKLLNGAAKQVKALVEATTTTPGTRYVTVPGEVGDVTIGSIVKTRPTLKVVVTDREKALAYAKENYPSEIRHVPAVTIDAHDELRESFTQLFTVTKTGRLVGPNGEMDVPGVAVVPASKSSIYATADTEAFAEMWTEFGALVPALLPRLIDAALSGVTDVTPLLAEWSQEIIVVDGTTDAVGGAA